jgi:surface antigen
MTRIKSQLRKSTGVSRENSRKRILSVAAYVGAFVIVGILVGVNIHPSTTNLQQNASSPQNISSNFAASSKLPVVTSGDAQTANIASTVATTSGLNSSDSASNRSFTMSAIVANSQTNIESANKFATSNATAAPSAITTYVVQNGENIATIATKNGISDQTLRDANNLSTDNIAAGTTINVPAVDGIIYTSVAGDTLASIVAKYGSNVDSITSVNNLNLNEQNIVAGTRLLLPDGKTPAKTTTTTTTTPTTPTSSNTLTSYSSSARTSSGSIAKTGNIFATPAYSGNPNYLGECTYYAYNRRKQLGLRVQSGAWGNANSWALSARSAGFTVNNIPSVGAIFQTTAGYYGHVGVVESVNGDGTITISEMNYAGWNVVDLRTITNPSAFTYIQ